jgi:formate hydrogenlyase subunit 6/NADH:ubiquinone oxidoreductase subunit I
VGYSTPWQKPIHAVRAAYTVLRRALAPGFDGVPSAPLRGDPCLVRDSEDRTRCTRCDACVSACPTSCIHIVSEDAAVAIDLDRGRCMRCGICADVCTVDALALAGCSGQDVVECAS